MEKKVTWISWHKPQVWTHNGYKFYMYQSENVYLNYRLLRMVRSDGSEVIDEYVPLKRNISPSAKRTQEYLKMYVAWDNKSVEEKASIIEANNNRLLF